MFHHPFVSLLSALVLCQPARAQALSTTAIASLLGSNAITGASVVLPKFTLSIITNTTFALVSINMTASPKSVGWVSVAPGTSMADADYLIAWPTISSASGAVSWTLSHRSATDQVMPTVASTAASTATNQFYTFIPSLSTNSSSSSYSLVSFLRPLAPPSSYPSKSPHTSLTRARNIFCYASASATFNPGSASESATLGQHDQAHATTALDLSTVITIPSTSSTSGSSKGNSSSTSNPSTALPLTATVAGTTTRDKWLAAHGILGFAAFLVVMPSAILLARYLRHTTWYPYHAALQCLAALLVLVTAAIGFWKNGASSTHGSFGILVALLVLLQVTFGYFAHRTPASPSPPSQSFKRPFFPTLSHKSIIRLVHIGFGSVVSLIGFAVVRMGIYQFGVSSDAANPLPNGVVVAFWILISALMAVYVAGWAKEAAGRGRRASENKSSEGVERGNRNSFILMERK